MLTKRDSTVNGEVKYACLGREVLEWSTEITRLSPSGTLLLEQIEDFPQCNSKGRGFYSTVVHYN